MPYKDPERKKQWEREHREQRDAQQRRRIVGGGHSLATLNCEREFGSTPAKETQTEWESFLALAIGLGAIVLGAMGGLSTPLPSDAQGPHWTE